MLLGVSGAACACCAWARAMLLQCEDNTGVATLLPAVRWLQGFFRCLAPSCMLLSVGILCHKTVEFLIPRNPIKITKSCGSRLYKLQA